MSGPKPFATIAAALLLACSVIAPPASAQAPDPKAADAHRKEDVARHRTIAAAHDAAAKCLESGQKEASCHEALRKACQGIAVGRYCGMRHSH
jgi:hypothetical protein